MKISFLILLLVTLWISSEFFPWPFSETSLGISWSFLIFLVLIIQLARYERVIGVAFWLSVWASLISIFNPSIFFISYLLSGFLMVFLIKNYAPTNWQGIALVVFLGSITYQLLFISLIKFYPFLNLTAPNFLVNSLYFKNLFFFSLGEALGVASLSSLFKLTFKNV